MVKKNNYNNLIRLNIIFRIVILVNVLSLVFIIITKKPYELNLSIIKVIISIITMYIFISIFKLSIQRIVLQKCDYVSHLLYLNKIFKNKKNSERVINQINIATTYLMLGKYAETKDILNKLNTKLQNVNQKNYMHIYMLNLKYLAESQDKEALEKFLQEKWDIIKSLDKVRNKQYILSEIKIWKEIIEENWENVIQLIQQIEVVYESSKIVFTYWYAVANQKMGNVDIANNNFKYVSVYGKDTVYAGLVEKEILPEDLKLMQSVVKKRPCYVEKIVCFICIVILFVFFVLWYSIIHFNTNTEDILKNYNFTVNQEKIQKIYSESFDEYVYEIFMNPKQSSNNIYKMFLGKDIFYYCLFKKEGKYYQLLDCYVSDTDEIYQYKSFSNYLDDEELDKVKIADMEFYVNKCVRSFKKFSEKEKYGFPCIGVYDDEKIKNVEVNGKLPEIESFKIQGKEWYIWKYYNINYSDSSL